MSAQDDLSLPVFAGVEEGSFFKIRALFGTAIPLGGEVVLTADHVALNAKATGKTILVGHQMFSEGAFPVNASSILYSWPDLDLAILRVPGLPVRGLNWSIGPLGQMTEVRSLGFAYGLDLQENTVTGRAFVGHIVASRPFGVFAARPWVYELSFATPRGLSGAPLFVADGPVVCGCVVANHRTEMLVFSDREVIEEVKSQRCWIIEPAMHAVSS